MSDKKQAEKWLEEATFTSKKGKFKDAIEILQKAIPIFRKEEDWENVVACLNKWCECLGRGGQIAATVEKALEALSLSRNKLGEFSLRTSICLNNLGIGYKSKGDFEKALACYHESLDIMLQLKDSPWMLANTYSNLGVVYEDIGNHDKSIDYHEKSLKIRIELFGEENSNTASNYNNLGGVYNSKGDFEKAIEYHERSLKIKLETLGEIHPSTANSFNNLGVAFWSKGDYDKSIDLYNRSLYIRLKALGRKHPDTATSLNTLGVVYHTKGDFEKAIDYYKQSLEIRRSIFGEFHQDIGDSLNNLGAVYLRKGDFEKAINYNEKSLAIRLQTVGGVHVQTAKIFNNIGVVYGAKGEENEAFDYLNKALNLYLQILGERHPLTAKSYLELGKVFFRKQQFESALKYGQFSLNALCKDFTSMDFYQTPSLSNCLSFLNLLNVLKLKSQTFHHLYLHKTNDYRDLIASFRNYYLANQLIIFIRQSYQSDGSKLTLAQKSSKIYEEAIEVTLTVAEIYKKESKIEELQIAHQELQTLNPDHILPRPENSQTLAFNYAEQSKSILLLSNIKDTAAKAAAHIPKDLLQKEYNLQIELNYLNKRIIEEQSEGKENNHEQILEWQNQHFDYKQKYNQLIEEFEANYPEYFRLKYEVKTVSIEDLQKELEPNTAMISYYLSSTQLYIFTITSSAYDVHQTELPNDFDELLEDYLFYIESLDKPMYIETAHQLYQLLLEPIIKLIEDSIKTNRLEKLIVIPHGKLLYLPFEALLISLVSPDTSYSELPYLIQKYAISYHYSATLFHHSSHQKKTETTKNRQQSFIGFAPVYADASAATDYQISPNKPSQNALIENSLSIESESPPKLQIPIQQYAAEATRSVRFNGKKYCELIYSEKEVKEVAKIFEREQGVKTQTLFHQEASKEQFFKQVQDYQYVLISAHGIRNDQQPELSGIIFSPNEGDSKEEIMYLSDAYHLQLDADLVVLSCCESGVGELAKGEGMMAMNRGFLYAGAKNIVFTLFKVYDKASSELTKALFEGILEEELSYSKALQRAKLQLIQRKGFTPKAWAGYVLIGN